MEDFIILRKKLKNSGKSLYFSIKKEESEVFDMSPGEIFNLTIERIKKEKEIDG